MPKRKRETEKASEPSVHPPLQKSAPLLTGGACQSSPLQEEQRQKRGNERCREFPSPSTTTSTEEDDRRDPSVLTTAYPLEQRSPTQPSGNNNKKSTNGASFESHCGKTYSASFGSGAGHKRKHEKELSRTGGESRKRPRKDSLAKQKVGPEEPIPKTNVPVIESLEKPAKKLKVLEIERKDKCDPIRYWATHTTWPENFADYNPMDSANSTNKRPRRSDPSQSGKDERSPSYSQGRKNGEVPEQYTAAYERFILIKGLNMNYRKGREFVSEESKKTCSELLRIDINIVGPTAVPQDKISDVIDDCQNRNEPIVNRDVTQLIVPSIRLSYYCGASHLEHIVDEVNADWYDQCVLVGPILRPDLAIGLSSSAFTEEEVEKLNRYRSVDNWTQMTLQMAFPFLMCEVKCGREALQIADRQNMHSCSVAVRALFRIEEEADKYRMDKRMDSLNGKVLVFSISHDQQDARLHGHYAIVQRGKWTYYRYLIEKFNLLNYNGLLGIHNVVRNVLESHLPGHLQRLKDALAALPAPNEPPGSTDLPISSGLSFAASGILLNHDNSREGSQDRDADGFVVPSRPDSSQNGEARKKGQESRLVERIGELMQQLQEEREENRKREERQRQQLQEEREENRKREERQREEQREEMDKLLQRLLGRAAD